MGLGAGRAERGSSPGGWQVGLSRGENFNNPS